MQNCPNCLHKSEMHVARRQCRSHVALYSPAALDCRRAPVCCVFARVRFISEAFDLAMIENYVVDDAITKRQLTLRSSASRSV